MDEEDEVEFPFDLSEWMVLDDDVGEAECSPLDHSRDNEGNNTTQSSETVLNESVKPEEQSQPETHESKSSSQTVKVTSKIDTKEDRNKDILDKSLQSTKLPIPVSSKSNKSPHGSTELKNTTNSGRAVATDAKAKQECHTTSASAKAVSASPKAVSASPKAVSVSLKAVSASPKAVSASLKAVTASPQAVTASPKVVTDSSKAVGASPKAVSASPKVVGSSLSKAPGTPLVTKSAEVEAKSSLSKSVTTSTVPSKHAEPTIAQSGSSKTEHVGVSITQVASVATSTVSGNVNDSVSTITASVMKNLASSIGTNGAAVKPEAVAVIASSTKTSSPPANSQPLKATATPLSNLANLKSSSQIQSAGQTKSTSQTQSSGQTPSSSRTQSSGQTKSTNQTQSSGQTKSTSQTQSSSRTQSSGQTQFSGQTKSSGQTQSSGQTKSTSQIQSSSRTQSSGQTHSSGQTKSSGQTQSSGQTHSSGQTKSSGQTQSSGQTHSSGQTKSSGQTQSSGQSKSSGQTQSSNSISSQKVKISKPDSSELENLNDSRPEIKSASKSGNAVTKEAPSKSECTIRSKQETTETAHSDKSRKALLKPTSTHPGNTSSISSVHPIKSTPPNVVTAAISLSQPSISSSQENSIAPSGKTELSSSSISQTTEMVITPVVTTKSSSNFSQKITASQQPHTAHTPKINVQKHVKVDTESIAAVMEAVDKFNVESGRQQSFDFDGSDISDTELDDVINLEVQQKLAAGGKRDRTETKSEPAKKRLKVDETVAPPNLGAPDMVTKPDAKKIQGPGCSPSSNKKEKTEILVVEKVKPENKTKVGVMASTPMSTDTSGPSMSETPISSVPTKAMSKRIIRRFHRSTQTTIKETENKQLQCIIRSLGPGVRPKTTAELGVQTVGPKKPDWRDEIRHLKLLPDTVKPEVFKIISDFDINRGLENITSVTYKYGISLGHISATDLGKGSFRENILFKSESFSFISLEQSIGVVKLFFTDKDSFVGMMTQIRKLRIGQRYLVVTVSASLDESERDPACPLSVVKATVVFDQNFSSTYFLNYSKVPAWNKPKVEVVATIHNVPGGIPLDFLKIVIPDAVSMELDDKNCKFTQEGRRVLVGLNSKNGSDRVFKLLSLIYLNNEYVIPTNTTKLADRVPELKELQEARVKWQTETDLLFPASNVKDKERTAQARDINVGKNNDESGMDTGIMESDHGEQEKSLSELPNENISVTVGQFDSGIDTNVMEALSDISDTSNLGNESPDKKVKLHEIASLKATLRTMAKNKPRKTEPQAHKAGIKKAGQEKSKVQKTSESQKHEKKGPRKEGQTFRSRAQKESDRKPTSQRPHHKSVSDKKLHTDRSKRPRTLRPSVKSGKRSEGTDALKEKKMSTEQQSHHKRQSREIDNKTGDRGPSTSIRMTRQTIRDRRSREIDNKTGDRGPSTSIRTARQTSRDRRSHEKKRVSGSYSEHVRRQSADTDSTRFRQTSEGKLSESVNTGQLMDTLLRSLSVVEFSAKGENFTRLVTEKLTNLIEEQGSTATGLKEERWKRSRSPVRRQIARRRSVSPSQSSFKPGSTFVRAKSPAIRRVFMSRKSLSPHRPPEDRMLSPRPPVPPRNHSPGRHFQVSSHPLQDSNSSRYNQNRGASPRHHHVMSPIRRSEESGSNNLREGMWLSQPPQTPQTYQGPDPRSNIQIVSGRNREEDLRKGQGASKNLVSIQSEWAAVPPGGQTNAGRPLDGQDLLDKFIGQMKRSSQSHPTNSRANFGDAPKLDGGRSNFEAAPKLDGGRSNFGGTVNFIDSGIGLGGRNTSDLGQGGVPSGPGPYNTVRGENTESVPGTYNTVRRENNDANQGGQRFDTPYRPQAGANNWFGRQESKPAFERPQETFDRSQFSADYQQQNQNMNAPPPIPPPVAPPILNQSQSLSSQDRISQLEALAKQLAMDIQKQQPAHHGQPFWPFSMQQQQNTMNMPRQQATMMGAPSQPSMMSPPSQHSTMGPPLQSSMMGPPSQSSMMGQPSQPSMLRGPAPVHMQQGYLPQTQTMGSQPSSTFPGANAWQRGRNF